MFPLRPECWRRGWEKSRVLGWELSAISPSPPDLQEEYAGRHSEVKNHTKRIKHPLQTKPFSDDADLQYLLTQASPTPPTSLVLFLSLSLPPFRCCSCSLLSFGSRGHWSMAWLLGVGSVWSDLLWSLCHTDTHIDMHTHLWKWGSWPPSLKCPVRDWGWRWMAVVVCDTGGGGSCGGVKGLGICGWACVVPYGRVTAKKSGKVFGLSVCF